MTVGGIYESGGIVRVEFMCEGGIYYIKVEFRVTFNQRITTLHLHDESGPCTLFHLNQ
jgi:hypothetical protein